MALLGSSVDPRLFLQDYSGFTRAAEINAQAMQGLGQNIGKAISDYGDLKKEQKKEQSQLEQEIRQAEYLGNVISKNMPQFSSEIDPLLFRLSDKNIPISDRATDARMINDVLNLGIKSKEMQYENEIRSMQLNKMRQSMVPQQAPAEIDFFAQ